jgi:hypothetical protein
MMPDPDPTAQADQAGAAMRGAAQIMGEYFNALLAQGFERAEAMELVHHHLERSNEEESE